MLSKPIQRAKTADNTAKKTKYTLILLTTTNKYNNSHTSSTPREAGTPLRRAAGSRPDRKYAIFSLTPEDHEHSGQRLCSQVNGSRRQVHPVTLFISSPYFE